MSDKVVNIEMQLADNDDHLRRVRYNAACITVDRTDTGTTFTMVAELMACFLATYVNHPKFPNVSNRVNFIKNTEKGREYMCEIMDELIKENEEKVRKEEREKAVFRMIKKGFPVSDIADVLDVSIEYIKSILTTSAALK